MKLMSIASGSSGNCVYVGTDNTAVIVDAGVSRKRINEGLATIDMNIKDVDAIIITHEHIDHTRALGVISRSYGIPMYATEKTCEVIADMRELGDFDKSLLNPIETDVDFDIGDIRICAHSIWHDAVDPVCYTMKADGKKISVATDMGGYDDYTVHNLQDSDAMLVEANHDIRMLQAGPYPYSLKQRILGQRGHLSNEASGQLINNILNNHIKAIFLGHLSNENNYPELAYETVKTELMGNPYTNDVRDFNLQVAGRSMPSSLIEL